MEGKPFIRRLSPMLPVCLIVLLISLPTGAQTDYSIAVVTPSYIEANTLLPLVGDDTYYRVDLPFSFTFYGVAYTQAYVSTNGYLSFTGGSSYYYNTPLPTTANPNGAIYPFWDDLIVDWSASMRAEVFGTAPNRQFVIEWRNVRFYNWYGGRLDFEIVLHETGVILIQYRNINNDLKRGSSATVGIEDHTGTAAAQYSYNSIAIGSGEFAIRFGHLGTPVPVDIKPMGCPNPLNVHSQGVLPVAILGTADFDVTTIDPGTVTLAGVAPLRWSLEDVATPYEHFVGKTDPSQCTDLGPDGYLDLGLKFDTQEIVASLGDVQDQEVLILELGGQLLDGMDIIGEDVIMIIGEDVIIKGGKTKR